MGTEMAGAMVRASVSPRVVTELLLSSLEQGSTSSDASDDETDAGGAASCWAAAGGSRGGSAPRSRYTRGTEWSRPAAAEEDGEGGGSAAACCPPPRLLLRGDGGSMTHPLLLLVKFDKRPRTDDPSRIKITPPGPAAAPCVTARFSPSCRGAPPVACGEGGA